MLLYNPFMPNTKSAKKAVRSSKTKQKHNLYWKNKFKLAMREVKKALDSKASDEVVQEKMRILQKALDKAAKKNVIHKTKASRVKSRYAKKFATQSKSTKSKEKPKKAPKAKTKPPSKSRSK